jgi:putative transposase
MDATGTAVRETQFRGCSQASLYNTRRPHSSIGYRTPATYANHLTATGHRAALHEGSARCPVAHTAPKGVSTAEALIATG